MDFGLEISRSLLAKVIHAGLGFAGSIILARALGPTSFGGYYLLLSVAELAKRGVDGVSSATNKRFAEVGTPRRQIIGTQLLANLALTVVVACGAFLFQSQLVEYTGVADAVILLILLFTITSNYTSFNSFLASTGQLSTQNWINTVQSITVLVGQLLLVALGLGVSGMAYGLALGEIILIPLIHY
jgi:O-antigen/teichoic acid export membrane protein